MTWQGRENVAVTEVPDPIIKEPTDAHHQRSRRLRSAAPDLRLYSMLQPISDRRRRCPGPRDDGHRPGGGIRGHPHLTGRPGRGSVHDLVRPLLECATGACSRSARRRRTRNTTAVSLFVHTSTVRAGPGGQAETCGATPTSVPSPCPTTARTTGGCSCPTFCRPRGRGRLRGRCHLAVRWLWWVWARSDSSACGWLDTWGSRR